MNTTDDPYNNLRKTLIEEKGFSPDRAEAAVELHRQLAGLCRRMHEEFDMPPAVFVRVAHMSLQALAITLLVVSLRNDDT